MFDQTLDRGNAGFELGVYAADGDARIRVACHRHPLAFDKRRGAHDVLARQCGLSHRPPIFERPLEPRDRRVRNHAQRPVLQLVLETVHNRKHDN